MSNRTQRVTIGEVRFQLAAFGTPTQQSARRFGEIAARFEVFLLNGFGIEAIDQIAPEHAAQFVHAKGSTGETSNATKHLRRSTLRLLFRIARTEFGYEGDPTIDLILPPRSSLAARPLTEEEVALGRSFSQHTLTTTRQPAAWALSEATATTGELPHITSDDLDLDNTNGPRVWLHGSVKRIERWALLDDWGANQVERQARSLKKTKHLIYSGNAVDEVKQISACIAIKDTMIRAGLASEPDIRPLSLVAWAGQVALKETGSIEGAARRLGIRSLDAAARLINFNWQD